MDFHRDARKRALRIQLRATPALAVVQIDHQPQIAEGEHFGLEQVRDGEDVVDHRAVQPLLLLVEFDVEPQRIVEPGQVLRERSEEHTSELQSLAYLVCRLLLEKKKKKKYQHFLFKKNKKKQ